MNGAGSSWARAAIDCGTNSTRLLIVDSNGAPIVRLMRITRLGQGVDATHKLDRDAIDRTLAVLSDYRREMRQHHVVGARMVATSAVRDAVNGQEFLDAASEVTGVRAELLSGEEEGRLSYAGATAGLPPAIGDDVVLDIGGGSTELIVRSRAGLGVVSLDIGCVRLTERCLVGDPPTNGELARTAMTIDEALDLAGEVVPALRHVQPGSRLIGLAGTVSTLSMLEQGLAEYDRDRVHHSVLSRPAVGRWCEILAAEPAAARARRPGMVAGREDVLLGGALVLRTVMDRFGFVECLVSESDILDGLVGSLRGTGDL